MNISLVSISPYFSAFSGFRSRSSTLSKDQCAMYKVTSGGSLNVILQPSPFPVIKGSQTNLKVSFDQKGSSALQAHVDFTISQL